VSYPIIDGELISLLRTYRQQSPACAYAGPA
jgi:hypothetical protein